MDSRLQAFERLLNIMDDLRAGCPWDKEQTFESLRHLTLEETYELSDAILKGDLEEIKKELGDIMLHMVFYAKLGSEQNAFEITDVLNGICEKLIYRHPHIYANVDVKDARQVADNWEKLKLKEGKKSVLEGVPDGLPPLLKAYRIQAKVKGVGFDWEEPEQVWQKVEEELNELKTEVESGADIKKIEGEFGDLLFALVNYARFIDVNPDDALDRTNLKFKKRFQYLEKKAQEQSTDLKEMSLAEMDIFWEEAKKFERPI